MITDAGALPAWVIWQRRPFPDTNLLLLTGRRPVLVDSGFVAHAQQTAAWVRSHTDQLAVVVNTHWHSDHVGGNALLQAAGARIAASVPDAAALADLDPGCCQAQYLDQPVPQYTVDEPLTDGQALLMGDAEWQVIGTPGHTRGHLSFWQPDHGLLIVGDAVSDYDVGWVNIAVDGPDCAATALASLQRLSDLEPEVILPAHGPIPADPATTFTTGLRRARRLVQDPAGAIGYGARRILAFALIIQDGIPGSDIHTYVQTRPWAIDAARTLDITVDEFAADLIESMLRSGAITMRDNRFHATADHSPVVAESPGMPFPADWSNLGLSPEPRVTGH